jgi:hypothetical protein
VDEASAREHLRKTLGLGSAERELLTPLVPRHIRGPIPTATAVAGVFAGSAHELQVIRNVEGVAVDYLGVDLQAGDGLLIFILDPSRSSGRRISTVGRAIDLSGCHLTYTCVLNGTEEHALGLDKDMGTPSDSRRNIALRRSGFGIILQQRTEDGVAVIARGTGGGLSPLDKSRTPLQFERATDEGDFLALRRALAAWHRDGLSDDARAERAAKLVTPRDPFTAYWAARYLAGAGRFDVLRDALSDAEHSRGLGDYLVSAVYQGVGDCGNAQARRFLMDAKLFRELCEVGYSLYSSTPHM